MSFEQPPKIEQTENKEEIFDFEEWLIQELETQYKEKANILRQNGLLEIIPEVKEMGITALDGQEYPFPKKEEIKQRILENREFYETKMRQGFTEMEIVPCLPLNDIIKTVKQATLLHAKQEKLFTKDKDGNKIKITLDENLPENERAMYVWNEYDNADVNGTLARDPKEFSDNHQGKTDLEFLTTLPFKGFEVILREKDLVIPREGKGEVIAGRKRLEAGKVFSDYLKIIKDDTQYKGETIFNTKSWLIAFLVNLEQTDFVMDDYQNEVDCVSINGGDYFSASGFVPNADWDRVIQRAYLDGSDPGHRNVDCGVRPAVRVS